MHVQLAALFKMSMMMHFIGLVLQAVNLRDGLAEVRDEAEERVLAMLEEIETQSGGQVSHQGPGVSTMSYPSSPVANKDDGRSRQQEDGLPTPYSHTTVQSGALANFLLIDSVCKITDCFPYDIQ